MAMDPISFATSFYPATLHVLNTAVAIMLLMRRRALAWPAFLGLKLDRFDRFRPTLSCPSRSAL